MASKKEKSEDAKALAKSILEGDAAAVRVALGAGADPQAFFGSMGRRVCAISPS